MEQRLLITTLMEFSPHPFPDEKYPEWRLLEAVGS
jgi:hypothetical protein